MVLALAVLALAALLSSALVVVDFGAVFFDLAGAFLGFAVLLALIPQLLGHTTYNWALRYLSAAIVSILLLSEPIGSTVLAYFFLHEAPTILKLFGAILILSGIYVASRKQSKS